ncbi:hypothetical protein H6F67_26950 [Microcoleus sp. FACHB-1515]|uniref:hypothetical protein n=1 Tax=Cyanophyceae TaxID=3028117 RepID=UPI0016873A9F|nr:hypothetical protein [Microcoleus sp. FACHB-1515]MBD2093480.1 hypothetical protein [Microcoleus sp. FACHB-1515]
MESSIDLIAQQIAEYAARIEEYKREILRLRRAIQALSWRAVEADDGEITHFDDID